MNCLGTKSVRAAVLVGIASLGMISGSLAGEPTRKFKYIKNLNPDKTANDLHITFSGEVSWTKMLGQGFKVLGGSSDNLLWQWVHGQIWTMPPGAEARIDYYSETDVEIKTATWTLGGTPITGFKEIANPPGATIDYDPLTNTHLGYVYFHNTEPFAVKYTAVQVFKNNNMQEYFNDDWVAPTGTKVAAPRRIVLQPGQTQWIEIGEVQQGTYILVTANAEEVGVPNDKYGVGCGVPVVP